MTEPLSDTEPASQESIEERVKREAAERRRAQANARPAPPSRLQEEACYYLTQILGFEVNPYEIEEGGYNSQSGYYSCQYEHGELSFFAHWNWQGRDHGYSLIGGFAVTRKTSWWRFNKTVTSVYSAADLEPLYP